MNYLELPTSAEVLYCKTLEQCSKACSKIKKVGLPSVWGFDIEWRVSFKKGVQYKVALLQLCHGNLIVLIHLFAVGLTAELAEIIKDERFIKVGVNIAGDITRIQKDYAAELSDAHAEYPRKGSTFEYDAKLPSSLPRTSTSAPIRGVLDLRTLYNALRSTSASPRSLAALCETELGGRILNKAQDIRCGNWECLPLSKDQLKYAALDAFASYEVYRAIVQHWKPSFASVPTPSAADSSAENLSEAVSGCSKGSCPPVPVLAEAAAPPPDAQGPQVPSKETIKELFAFLTSLLTDYASVTNPNIFSAAAVAASNTKVDNGSATASASKRQLPQPTLQAQTAAPRVPIKLALPNYMHIRSNNHGQQKGTAEQSMRQRQDAEDHAPDARAGSVKHAAAPEAAGEVGFSPRDSSSMSSSKGNSGSSSSSSSSSGSGSGSGSGGSSSSSSCCCCCSNQDTATGTGTGGSKRRRAGLGRFGGWPAKTSDGAPCQLCLRRTPGVFCAIHTSFSTTAKRQGPLQASASTTTSATVAGARGVVYGENTAPPASYIPAASPDSSKEPLGSREPTSGATIVTATAAAGAMLSPDSQHSDSYFYVPHGFDCAPG